MSTEHDAQSINHSPAMVLKRYSPEDRAELEVLQSDWTSKLRQTWPKSLAPKELFFTTHATAQARVLVAQIHSKGIVAASTVTLVKTPGLVMTRNGHSFVVEKNMTPSIVLADNIRRGEVSMMALTGAVVEEAAFLGTIKSVISLDVALDPHTRFHLNRFGFSTAPLGDGIDFNPDLVLSTVTIGFYAKAIEGFKWAQKESVIPSYRLEGSSLLDGKMA